jgi:hypothetical protein
VTDIDDVIQSRGNTDIYIEEVLKWLPNGGKASDENAAELIRTAPQTKTNAKKQKVLLADDNADMRAYLSRLLSQTYNECSNRK